MKLCKHGITTQDWIWWKNVKKMAAARFPTVSCKIGLQLKPKLYPNFPNMPSLFPPLCGHSSHPTKKPPLHTSTLPTLTIQFWLTNWLTNRRGERTWEWPKDLLQSTLAMMIAYFYYYYYYSLKAAKGGSAMQAKKLLYICTIPLWFWSFSLNSLMSRIAAWTLREGSL